MQLGLSTLLSACLKDQSRACQRGHNLSFPRKLTLTGSIPYLGVNTSLSLGLGEMICYWLNRGWLCSKIPPSIIWDTCRMASDLGNQRRGAFRQAFWYERNSWGARMKEKFLLIILHSVPGVPWEGREAAPNPGESQHWGRRSFLVLLTEHNLVICCLCSYC